VGGEIQGTFGRNRQTIFGVRTVAGLARQRRAYARRKHRRYRRRQDRVCGLTESAWWKTAGENRWFHAGATVFPWLRSNLALGPAGRGSKINGEHEPAFACALPRYWSALGI